MRRKDREVTDIGGVEDILSQCRTCRVAMVDDGAPYVVPLSYGYRIVGGNTLVLYFHSAPEGRKLDILRSNKSVCFEISYEGEPVDAEKPCNSGYYYASVIGFGEAEFIDDAGTKCEALSTIFKRQTGGDAVFTAEEAEGVCVFRIVSADFSGKRKPKPEA